MVKKKNTSSARKKKSSKRGTAVIASLKHLFYTACFFVVILAGVLFVYEKVSDYAADKDWSIKKFSDWVPDIKQKDKTVENAVSEVKDKIVKPLESQLPKTSESKTVRFQQGAELPVCPKSCTEQVIRHKGYTVSYNSDYRVANWVAYELTSQEAKSNAAERSNKFVRDPMVKGASAENGDYTRTGYDRGHLAPAGDMKWSAQAMRESFYLSNITPQKPGLNRGVWKDLEEQCRMWAADNGKLLIATGPVLTPDLKRLGKNRVAIPKKFYKVICMIQDNKYEAVGFIFENKDYGKTSLRTLMVPVDSVERLTQIDFFASMPDSIEDRMEATVNQKAWSY